MAKYGILTALMVTACIGFVPQAHAATSCKTLPAHDVLQKALSVARHDNNGGFGNDMWGAVVDRSGAVCAVAYTGSAVDAQWLGSRGIAIEKANTANAFSLSNFALSTANLYAGSQPGGFLFGLLNTDPIDGEALHKGPMAKFGSNEDPAIGKVIGGLVVFGGGVPLYDAKGTLVGALGVSGDTSCADHNIAWKTRNGLNLDYVPAGVANDKKNDQILYDIGLTGKSSSGFGHPDCNGHEEDVAKQLPDTKKAQK